MPPPDAPDGPADRWVRDTYDRIGAHFARTRPEPWEEVRRFLEGRSGDLGLDVGVGNGRHAELLRRDGLYAALWRTQARLREGEEGEPRADAPAAEPAVTARG